MADGAVAGAEAVPPTDVVDQNGVKEGDAPAADSSLQIELRFEGIAPVAITIQDTDTVHDIRQFVHEYETTCHLTCFHFELEGVRMPENVELAAIEGVKSGSSLQICEDEYGEFDVLTHLRRFRELLVSEDELALDGTGNISPCALPAVMQASYGDEPAGGKSAKNAEKENDQQRQPGNKGLVTALFDRDVNAGSDLSSFYPPSMGAQIPLRPLNAVHLSGWNPVALDRMIRGDIVYIDVLTAEDAYLCVTACPAGFYVNRSSRAEFDGNPHPSRTGTFRTLVALVSANSPTFKRDFPEQCRRIASRNPLEFMPTPVRTPVWVAFPQERVHANAVAPSAAQSGGKGQKKSAPSSSSRRYDVSRSEESLLGGSGGVPLGVGRNIEDVIASMALQTRDWNEEWQSVLELPSGTADERIARDRAAHRVASDFVTAAQRLVVDVAEGRVVALNAHESARNRMYVSSNMFVCRAIDNREYHRSLGGDGAARHAASKDLQHAVSIAALSVEGLHTVATAVVDYKGQRYTAQSIIPGIFRQEQEQIVAFGSIDRGVKVASDERFRESIDAVGKALKLKEHTVFDDSGAAVKLRTSLEVKGILGSDGRRYLLDLFRVTPVDANYVWDSSKAPIEDEAVFDAVLKGNHEPAVHGMRLLRRELIVAYDEAKFLELVSTTYQKRKSEKEALKAASANSAEGEQKAQEEEEEDGVDPNDPDIKAYCFEVNPDVLAQDPKRLVSDATRADVEADERVVREMAAFITDVAIPKLTEDIARFATIPLDGASLAEVMHQHGINVRYLGRLATACAAANKSQLNFAYSLCVSDMICRAAKHVLRAMLLVTHKSHVASAVSHFLNCLLGNAAPAGGQEDAGKAKKGAQHKSHTPPPYAALTVELLWAAIKREVSARFNFDVDVSFDTSAGVKKRHPLARYGIPKISLLRMLCLRTGIQVAARDYAFDSLEIAPFATADIRGMVPVSKNALPKSFDTAAYIEYGKGELQKGHVNEAYQYFALALSIAQRVYGPVHEDVAVAFGLLAAALSHADEPKSALAFQTNAVILSERVHGLDHMTTQRAYLSLAHTYKTLGHRGAAMRCVARARTLIEIMAGRNAMELPSVETLLGTLLLEEGHQKLAARYFTAVRDTQESVWGKISFEAAASNRYLAKALIQEADFKGALACEKTAYAVFEALFGKEDIRTMQSEKLLQYYTRAAVDKQVQEVLRQQQSQQRKKKSGEKSVDHGQVDGDDRSIADLLNFIEGAPAARKGGKISADVSTAANALGGRRVQVKTTHAPGGDGAKAAAKGKKK